MPSLRCAQKQSNALALTVCGDLSKAVTSLGSDENDSVLVPMQNNMYVFRVSIPIAALKNFADHNPIEKFYDVQYP